LSLKVTVPVGFTFPDAFVIVAVKVTACPRLLGLGDDASVVVVPIVPALTVWLIVPELPVKVLGTPLYPAVTVPVTSAVVVTDAVAVVPLPDSVAVPSVVVPSR
jgi:hypothetical protein